MKHRHGFTVIEVVVVILFLIVALALFLTQKTSIDAAIRDTERKTTVNALYHNLEEVYFEKTGYYPKFIDTKTLTALDPNLLTDPSGHEIGDPKSSIKYDSSDCTLDGKCQQYTLRADLEREAEYVKTNRETK